MILKNIRVHYVVLIVLFGFFSCSKKEEQVIADNGTPKLVFKSVQIVGDQLTISNKAKASVNNKQNDEVSATATSQMKSGLGFTSEVYAEKTSMEAGNSLSATSNVNTGDAISNRAATTPMTAGFTYRIILYNTTTNRLVKTILAKSGENFEIEVPKGDKFKWYAYSFNDAQNIPEPASLENPAIDMSVNKDFLYASGDIETLVTPQGQLNTYPINVVFNHKVAQVKVKIDASSLAQVANIESFKVSFLKNDYFKKGVFSIKENAISNLEVVPTDLVFNTLETTNIWEKSFYTADANSISEYQINVDDLTVNFFLADVTASRINLATVDPNNQPKFLFKYATAAAAGQQLSGNAQLNYVLQSRRIYHISNNTTYGYALQRGPGWEMINNLKNFGNLPNSLVKMLPYATGQGVWKGGTATDNLTSNWGQSNNTGDMARLLTELNNVATRPDIIISGYNSNNLGTALRDAIVDFVNQGGVYIMFNESRNTDIEYVINRIFDTNGMLTRSLSSAGTMYPLLQTEDNDRVLNGPFGDARGKLWGEDASTTVGITGMPANSALIYSYGQGINRTFNAADAAAVTMFKHKTKNFFYLGDGGLVSYNGGTSATICPFDYNPTTGRPIPKIYGNAGNGYTARSQSAYNGVVAGNLILWAGAIAEFNGIRPWKYGH